MQSSKKFFEWAFDSRAETVMKLDRGEEMSMEKMFISFCSHEPAFVSCGPAGLNASVKGVGFLPKDEYIEETLEAYLKHIASYDPEDKSYSKRGLKLLIEKMYGSDARSRIDFSKLGSLELAKKQSWQNYLVNKEAALIFHQPPMVSYKLKGTIEIYDEVSSGKTELYQRFINAQHDVYHTPSGMELWQKRPAYIFRIEEIYDNSASRNGFGERLIYPAPDME